MYIIYNHDGSIKFTNLNEFVQKGTNDKSIFVAIEGISTSDYTVAGQYRLPTGEVGVLSSTNDSLELDKETWNGKRVVLSTSFTLYAGIVNLTIQAIKNGSIFATYNVDIRVNETTLDPDATYDFTVAQIQELYSGWSGKQDSYSIHNMRNYESLESANADIESLVVGQVVGVKINDQLHFFRKSEVGAAALTEIALPYTTNEEVVHKTGFLNEDINGTKTFTSALPKAIGSQGTIMPGAENDLTPKKYVDEEIEKIKARSDVVDVVGTYDELLTYDTTDLGENDIIKVLKDRTHDNQVSYYRWFDNQFHYVGSANVYSREQIDDKLEEKQHKLTPGQNITIDANNVISATGSAGGNAQWGDIEGDIEEQADLMNKLSGKEDKSNKTTELNSSSTDVQYPSAKVVYDNLKDIREVAEGKSETIFMRYEESIARVKSSLAGFRKFYVYDLTNKFEDKTTELVNGDYDEYELNNSILNSQELEISYLSGKYFIYEKRGSNDFYMIQDLYFNGGAIKDGDNIYIYELNVPDRYLKGNKLYTLETTKVDISGKQDKLPTNENGYYKVSDGVISIDNPVTATAQDTDKLGSITIGGVTYSNIPFSISSYGGMSIGAIVSVARSYLFGNGSFLTNNTNRCLSVGNGRISGSGTNKAFIFSTEGGTNAISYTVCFDDNYNHNGGQTFLYNNLSRIFFRDANHNNNATSLSYYTSGYSLAERLNGLTITDNSITELDYNKVNAMTLEADRTFTFKTAPTSTGTNLSCKPEYKLLLNVGTACSITLPTATYKLVTNDEDNITLNNNVIALPVSSKIEISIQDNCIVAFNWAI